MQEFGFKLECKLPAGIGIPLSLGREAGDPSRSKGVGRTPWAPRQAFAQRLRQLHALAALPSSISGMCTWTCHIECKTRNATRFTCHYVTDARCGTE